MGFKAALLAGLLLGSTAAEAQTLLAVCRNPKGKTYSVSPKRGWENQRAETTSLSFVRNKAGQPDVIIRDRTGSRSVREDGANVRITHSSRDFSYFIITAIYRRAQVDTYQVRFGPDGSGRLMWNSFLSHMPPFDTTAGTLLIASCSR